MQITKGRSVSIVTGNKQENPFIEIGLKLKSFREEAGYTQVEAAFHIGVTKTTISSWETGRKLPSTDNLNKICTVYRVPESYLTFLFSLVEMSKNELIKTLCEIMDES
jgi:transcriptional regulator with XRE-family HTH domain